MLNNLGVIFSQLGKTSYALECFEKALRIYRDIGDLKEISISSLKLAVTLDESGFSAQALLFVLQAAHYANQINKTELTRTIQATLEKIFDHNKSTETNNLKDDNFTIDLVDPEVFIERGKIYYKILEQHDHALADYTTAINLNPALVKAYISRAVIYEETNNIQEAWDDYSMAISLDPKDAMAFCFRGRLAKKLRMFDTALADYEHFLQINPNDSDVLYEVGAMLGNIGELEQALPYFERAAELGDPFGIKYAKYTRQRLGLDTESTLNPETLAIEAFNRANSLEQMERAVTRFPLMGETKFMEQIMNKKPKQGFDAQSISEALLFIKRLAWLKQIVDEE